MNYISSTILKNQPSQNLRLDLWLSFLQLRPILHYIHTIIVMGHSLVIIPVLCEEWRDYINQLIPSSTVFENGSFNQKLEWVVGSFSLFSSHILVWDYILQSSYQLYFHNLINKLQWNLWYCFSHVHFTSETIYRVVSYTKQSENCHACPDSFSCRLWLWSAGPWVTIAG